MVGTEGEADAITRNAETTHGCEGNHAGLPVHPKTGNNGGWKRTGWKGAKKDAPMTPSEPDVKAVLDDDTIDLIYRSKQMWGILGNPDYADGNDGFGALMAMQFLHLRYMGRHS